ncbi:MULTISPECIES: lipocalin family protein [Aquimarina]|uniref:lipocalin family protein n=1 Tax=Aquimarina TaxID=290174 RepID=UPI000D687E26|nr:MULTISPECIES: lipocalin family protein [Aquimarina]
MEYKIKMAFALIGIGLIFFINTINAQKIDKTNLFEIWHLNSYKIKSKEYSPSKKEKNDYIHFKEDGTFVSKSENTIETGTWILNNNGGYILMIDDNNETIKAYIVSLSFENLILRFDVAEIKEVEVVYSSHL